MARVLHLLSQRPGHTGSGTTLGAIVHHAGEAGWDQMVSVGVPTLTSISGLGDLDPSRIRPVTFGGEDLPFDIPGMSDVMPYASTRFSCMSSHEFDAYHTVWTRHLARLVADFKPDVIHSHHIWILSSLVKNVAPDTPVVSQCHATGLRQMQLCPELAPAVREGCARNELFIVQNESLVAVLADELSIAPVRVHVVGVGYRDDIFNAHGPDDADGFAVDGDAAADGVEADGGVAASDGAAIASAPHILYAGKCSAAKGVPWLLDAFQRLTREFPDLVLDVAGGGAGDEAESLKARMEGMAPGVVLHGMLSQTELAALMRRASVFVLPSFYEGVPLVLAEALACGCRLVSTALPGVEHSIAGPAGSAIELVPLPRLEQIDRPAPEDASAFIERLTQSISRSLRRGPLEGSATGAPDALHEFRWGNVFGRIEETWRSAISSRQREE